MKAFSKLVELLEKRFGVVLGDLGNTVVKGVDDEGWLVWEERPAFNAGEDFYVNFSDGEDGVDVSDYEDVVGKVADI